MPKLDKKFYKEKSWGAISIKNAKDLPTLKLTYLMQILKARERKDATLLEMGSGSGRILTSIRDRDHDIGLTGIELSAEQVKLAKKANKGKRIDFVHCNAEQLPFKDQSFDYVIIMDFLEHIEQPQEALNEAARGLKPGGQLYAVVPAENQAWSPYWVSNKIFRQHFKEKTVGHIQQYKIKELEQMVRKSELKIREEKFSYHFLGSLMDYTLFTMLLNKKVANVFWSKNKYYQGEDKKPSLASQILNGMMSLGNAVAYYESRLMKNRRLFATAVHITARKSG